MHFFKYTFFKIEILVGSYDGSINLFMFWPIDVKIDIGTYRFFNGLQLYGPIISKIEGCANFKKHIFLTIVMFKWHRIRYQLKKCLSTVVSHDIITKCFQVDFWPAYTCGFK